MDTVWAFLTGFPLTTLVPPIVLIINKLLEKPAAFIPRKIISDGLSDSGVDEEEAVAKILKNHEPTKVRFELYAKWSIATTSFITASVTGIFALVVSFVTLRSNLLFAVLCAVAILLVVWALVVFFMKSWSGEIDVGRADQAGVKPWPTIFNALGIGMVVIGVIHAAIEVATKPSG